MRYDVLVIGGGIAGLSCAVALCREGLRPLVLEKGPACGGRARSMRDERTGDTVDIGPHILLSEYPNMLHLLEDLGTQDRLCWQGRKFLTLVDEAQSVAVHMHPLPAPLHFLPDLPRLPGVGPRDLLSNRRLIWHILRLPRADLDKLDARDAESELLRLGVSPRFIDRFWRSACMTIMNVPLDQCSAAALFRFFRLMIGKSGYQPGFPAIGLGELFVPPALARIGECGGAVRCETEVAALRLGADGAFAGLRLRDGALLEAGACVAALPPHELHALLPAACRDANSAAGRFFAALPRFRPSPYICSYLWFDRKLGDERFWSRMWTPEILNFDFYDLSNIREGWRRRPSVIASNIMFSQRADGLDDEAIIARTREELAARYPQAREAALLHARVHRVPMGIPAPHPGSEALRLPSSGPVTGLWLAGDWTATGLPCSMESAVCSGFRAAEGVLASLGRPRRLHLPAPDVEGLVRLFGSSQQQ